jgi:hypothetical protein
VNVQNACECRTKLIVKTVFIGVQRRWTPLLDPDIDKFPNENKFLLDQLITDTKTALQSLSSPLF